jgi:hypothetical protein
MMLFGHSLEKILETCSKTRSFILENVGFQRQLVELEAFLVGTKKLDEETYAYGTPPLNPMARTPSDIRLEARLVEVELLIPGFCTMVSVTSLLRCKKLRSRCCFNCYLLF